MILREHILVVEPGAKRMNVAPIMLVRLAISVHYAFRQSRLFGAPTMSTTKVYTIDSRRRPVDLAKRLAPWPKLSRMVGLLTCYGVADGMSAIDVAIR